jgi:hypothetical protein
MNNLKPEVELLDKFKDSISQSRSLGYNPSEFERMLNDYGAVGVAKRLIKSGDIQSGFKALISLGRKDLTMEAIMLDEHFKSLFTVAELEAAKWRLEQA